MARINDNPDAERPAPPAVASARPPAAGDLFVLFVRHGETPYNAERRIQGHTDICLSEVGRDQARLLARRLSAAWDAPRSKAAAPSFPMPAPCAVFTSDLRRAAETAEILTGGVAHLGRLPFTKLPLLRERGYGSWEGMTDVDVRARFPGAEDPEDGEPWESVAERMDRALALIQQSAADAAAAGAAAGADAADGPASSAPHTALVVGHGGSLRMFFATALGVDPVTAPHAFRRFHLSNTGLSAVLFRAGQKSKGRIVLVNDTAHLEIPF